MTQKPCNYDPAIRTEFDNADWINVFFLDYQVCGCKVNEIPLAIIIQLNLMS